MKTTTKRVMTAVLALATVVSVQAEDVTKHEFHFSPYIWLPSVDVTSTIPPLGAADIELDFGDILDNFDVFAISARAEYWWGQYGVVMDGLWADMDAGLPGPLNGTDIQISDGILDVLAGYRFNLGGEGPDAASMHLHAGGRYHYLKQELSGIVNAGGSRDWMEPVLGAQLLAPFGQKWSATARGDVGGFGISDASEITWSAMAGVGYEFAQNWMAKLGYRYYYIDYTDGSGASEFGLEGNMHGLWIGIAYGK